MDGNNQPGARGKQLSTVSGTTSTATTSSEVGATLG